MLKNKKLVLIMSLLLMTVLIAGAAGCTQKEGTPAKPTLIMADAGWDSIQFHNDVAAFILEHGYGYKTDVIPGTTPVTFEGMINGDIDIYMEVWTDNISFYQEAVDNGDVLELAVNFDDNTQGLYVPTYVIKGDPERGIKASAPDLKYVSDLAKYREVFPDQEDKSKGRIYGAIPGWAVDEIMTIKIEQYGLNETYNVFRPGSDAALSASMLQAIEKGEPWVGYYWEPTWIMGMYDMTLLEEPPYDKAKWDNAEYTCAFPPVPVTVCVSKDMAEKAPEVVEFLKNYETSSALTSEALAYMQENNVGTKEAAQWFLKNKQELWTKWIPGDIADKVKTALG